MISVWDRGSSVGVATSVRSGRPMMRGSPQQEEESALLFIASIPAQGLTQSSLLWMLRVKWTGRGVERSVLLKTTVIMPRGIPPTPSPSKCLVLVCRFFKQRDNFTFAVLTWLRTLVYLWSHVAYFTKWHFVYINFRWNPPSQNSAVYFPTVSLQVCRLERKIFFI